MHANAAEHHQHEHQHLEALTAGLSPEEIKRILAAGRRADARAGEKIFQTGETAEHIFLVVHGLLKVLFHDDESNHASRYLRPGDHFGVVSVLVGGPRAMTVEAVTDVVLIAIAKAEFDHLVESIPRFAANLCRSLAEWLVRRIDGHHLRAYPRAVALLRTTPRTHGVALQVGLALAVEGERTAVVTDRPAAWFAVKCDLLPLVVREEGKRQLEAFLGPAIAALEAGARVLVDLPADNIPPTWLLHCHEVWLLQERGTEVVPTVERLLGPAPGLADRLRVIWMVAPDEPLPPLMPHDSALTLQPTRIRVAGADTAACVRPGCLARLTHHLQGIHLGLALGGGGALGVAHVGVIRAMDRAGVYFDRVAGTSIGAIVAAGYAAGFSTEEVGQFFLEDIHPPWLIRYLPKGNLWYLLAHFRLGWLETKLRRHLFHYTFDQLLLPLHMVTADLQSGLEVVRAEGDVTQAVLESINLPGVSAPIRRDGLVLVDGGVLNNVPADVLRAHHANFVVASHLLTELNPDVGTQMWQLLFRIMEVQMRRLVVARNPAIDVTVTPRLADFRFEDFSRSAELIEVGEEAGEKMVPEIRRQLTELRARQKLS